MPSKPARVLGPYVNGDKFRLVVFEGGGRKSVVVASREEAQRVKEQIACMLGTRPQLTVGEALDELAAQNTTAGELVKLHYFAGFTIEQSADLLGISHRTAYRTWAFARAWLFRTLGGDTSPEGKPHVG